MKAWPLTVDEVHDFLKYCLWLERLPGKSSYRKPAWFDENAMKPKRDGIVFYSSGWGWRLRKDWREMFEMRFEIAPEFPNYRVPEDSVFTWKYGW